MVENNQLVVPPSFADIKLLLGEQRSGKSCTAVGIPTDDYYKNLNSIISPSGQVVKAKTLDDADKNTLEKCQIFPDVFKYVRVFSDDYKQSKIIKIPQGWMVLSTVKIFANFHLFGLRYVYITLGDIIQYINSDLLKNCYVLSDESVMTDARNSMTLAGKIMATFTATIGKRNIHFLQNAQLNGMVDKRLRAFATTKILCTYEETTKTITCDIKERNKPPKSVSYYAPLYWPFFDSTELIAVPEKKLAGAYESVA